MCECIRLKNGNEIDTIEKFEEYFNEDVSNLGVEKNEQMVNVCLCEIDLQEYLKDNKKFEYEYGEWWEI